jgi:hypothetical protein
MDPLSDGGGRSPPSDLLFPFIPPFHAPPGPRPGGACSWGPHRRGPRSPRHVRAPSPGPNGSGKPAGPGLGSVAKVRGDGGRCPGPSAPRAAGAARGALSTVSVALAPCCTARSSLQAPDPPCRGACPADFRSPRGARLAGSRGGRAERPWWFAGPARTLEGSCCPPGVPARPSFASPRPTRPEWGAAVCGPAGTADGIASPAAVGDGRGGYISGRGSPRCLHARTAGAGTSSPTSGRTTPPVVPVDKDHRPFGGWSGPLPAYARREARR